jgi:hypothetical protein
MSTVWWNATVQYLYYELILMIIENSLPILLMLVVVLSRANFLSSNVAAEQVPTMLRQPQLVLVAARVAVLHVLLE